MDSLVGVLKAGLLSLLLDVGVSWRSRVVVASVTYCVLTIHKFLSPTQQALLSPRASCLDDIFIDCPNVTVPLIISSSSADLLLISCSPLISEWQPLPTRKL